MSGRMDWANAAKRDSTRPDTPSGGMFLSGRPPTSKQIDFLVALAKKAGEPKPSALNRAHAMREIDRLKRKLQ